MATVNVYGELNCADVEGKLARANQIYDYAKGKYQSEINDSVSSATQSEIQESIQQLETTLEDLQKAEASAVSGAQAAIGESKEDALEEIAQAIENLEVHFDIETDKGTVKDVQLKDGNGNKLMPITNVANLQDVDDVPTSGSDNLVKSGGVYSSTPSNNSNGNSNSDLDITDESGNILARFSDGNIKVKNFDSTTVNEKLSTIEVGAEVNDTDVTNNINNDLDITDENGNILLRIFNGHIRTRNFNSENVVQSSALEGVVFANTFDKTIAHDSPISIVEQNYGLCGIFYRWGFIGDSLSSGWLEVTSGDVSSKNLYRCSWGQVMCRALGVVGANFSNGGQTTSSWLSWYPNQTCTTWITNVGSANVKFSEDKKDVYTICLGVNDASGNVAVGDPSTDVDVNDYNNNNLNTYAGRYGKIISLCKEVSPSCKIFLITPPSIWSTGPETKGYNAVVRTLATMFDKVYLVDLASYLASNQSIIDNYQYNGSHPSTQGYIFYSYVIANYITYIIKQHPSDFKAQGAVEYLINNVDNY